MKQKTKKAIKQTAIIAIVLSSVLIGISAMNMKQIVDETDIGKTLTYPIITKEVLKHKPTIEKYAEEYEVTEHVDVLLAMMIQESKGRGDDPMQSSESYCGQVGCINDPELSIKQGVYYFSENLKAADGDLKLAVQSYNFGKGFIQYAKEQVGQYTQEVAIEFSQKMYEEAPDPSIYSCLREGAEEFNACDGDIYYVRDVMEYREVFAAK